MLPRAADGLWEEHRVEDVATPEGSSPVIRAGADILYARCQQLQQPEIQPNARICVQLESSAGRSLLLVTQNTTICMNARAIANISLHMHGELLKVRCSQSAKFSWNGTAM